MSVDSGLPDFRGPEDFWRACPPPRTLGLHFEDMTNPRWFDEEPQMAWNLDRFVEAQDENGTWERALTEIESGRKVGHWMWFVFPQHVELGHSSKAKRYGISGIDEARAYLDHAVLGPRLRRAVDAVLKLDASPEHVFGPTDAMKLRSCVTLFYMVAPDEPRFHVVLVKFYDGVADPATLRVLR